MRRFIPKPLAVGHTCLVSYQSSVSDYRPSDRAYTRLVTVQILDRVTVHILDRVTVHILDLVTIHVLDLVTVHIID